MDYNSENTHGGPRQVFPLVQAFENAHFLAHPLSVTHGGPRQVFRLVQAFESGEKQDAEKLAEEIDGLDGGRNVDGPAVKA